MSVERLVQSNPFQWTNMHEAHFDPYVPSNKYGAKNSNKYLKPPTPISYKWSYEAPVKGL